MPLKMSVDSRDRKRATNTITATPMIPGTAPIRCASNVCSTLTSVVRATAPTPCVSGNRFSTNTAQITTSTAVAICAVARASHEIRIAKCDRNSRSPSRVLVRRVRDWLSIHCCASRRPHPSRRSRIARMSVPSSVQPTGDEPLDGRELLRAGAQHFAQPVPDGLHRGLAAGRRDEGCVVVLEHEREHVADEHHVAVFERLGPDRQPHLVEAQRFQPVVGEDGASRGQDAGGRDQEPGDGVAVDDQRGPFPRRWGGRRVGRAGARHDLRRSGHGFRGGARRERGTAQRDRDSDDACDAHARPHGCPHLPLPLDAQAFDPGLRPSGACGDSTSRPRRAASEGPPCPAARAT
jgi:hypothetical protein